MSGFHLHFGGATVQLLDHFLLASRDFVRCVSNESYNFGAWNLHKISLWMSISTTAFNRSNQINLTDSNSTTVGGYPGYGTLLGYDVTQNGNINHFYTLNVWTVVNKSVHALTYEGRGV